MPKGLEQLSEKLRELPIGGSVIVVDNASDDETPDIVRHWKGPVPVRLLHCAEPGKGAAVRAGLLATQASYVGFCDADMATDLTALDDVLALLAAGHRVVVGSRGHSDSIVEARHDACRHFGAVAFNRLARQIVGEVSDTQCGFKFFDGHLARRAAVNLRTTGFSFDVELLMRCRRLGANVREIPVRWEDVPGSTFSTRRHSVDCLRELARIWRLSRKDTASVTFASPVQPGSVTADLRHSEAAGRLTGN